MGPFSPSFLPADFVIGWIRRVETIGPPIRQTHPSINQTINQSIRCSFGPEGGGVGGDDAGIFHSVAVFSPSAFFFLGPFLFRPSNSIYGHPTHDRNAIKSAGRGVVVGRIRHQPPRPARRLNFSYFVDINGSMRAVY